MPWTVARLNVDFNQNRASVELDSNSAPSNTVTMDFQVPASVAATAQTLDDVTRKAVLAQAKQVLIDAANSL